MSRLIDDLGYDCGEIIESEYMDRVDSQCVEYRVWVDPSDLPDGQPVKIASST